MIHLTARSNTRDMTTGTIWKHLILFSIPLLIGNFFQQLYNTVDSVIVGNFVSSQALAAVGSTAPVINTLLGTFMGLATGAGVVISNYFGAKDQEKLESSIHTTMLLTLLLGIAFTIIGILMVPFMLRFMSTPSDVMHDATIYLRIYFGGMIAVMVYNMGAGILRAVGDSTRPLYFLCVTSVLNILFDLLFVVVFHMGIAGVACATVLSEIISAGLVLTVLMRTHEVYRLSPAKLHINPDILKQICVIGIPAALQMAVTSFSNVFVQSYINRFGSSCMAGWTSYTKIDQLVILPMQSLSMAATTFTGQNLGAGNQERIEKGMKTALGISLAITIALTVFINLATTPLIRLFTSQADVLNYGCIFLRFMSPFYVCCCFNQIHSGVLRGSGDATGPMIIMLSSFVVFRQLYLFTVTRFIHTLYPVAFAYPAGWILCSVLMFFYYRWHRKKGAEAMMRTYE